MKKTFTINLNNTVFHIDDDAYELLQSYLAEVSHHFKSETEKGDIMSDIEARIAELFLQKMDTQKNVITIEDVGNIISIMGKPDQFTDENEPENNDGQAQTSSEQAQSSGNKKYYRDIDNRLLSGVASGLAAFLNWDVALVRVIFVVLAFITSGTFIIIYLLMWIIVPKAVTTAQKLEMHGEDVNIQTIKNKMNDAKEYIESDKFKNSASDFGTGLVNFIGAFFRVIVTIIGSIISIVGSLAIALLIFSLVVYLLEPEAITSLFPEFFAYLGLSSPDKIILLIISIILIIGCPVFALIYWSLRNLSKDNKPKSASGLWVALILWLAGIFMFIATGAETMKKLIVNDGFGLHKEWTYEKQATIGNINTVTESRSVPHFTAIKSSYAINIELTQQAEQSLSISTLSDYMPNVKTEVIDGELRLYVTEKLIRPNITVKIGIDSLSKIEANSASKIKFMTPFNLKTLNIDLNGASKSDINIGSAQKLNISISGAGKLDAEGNVDSLLIDSNGASKIDATNLRSKYVNIDLSGASKAQVYATDEFKGDSNGASSITCYGNPLKRTNSISGASKIDFK